MDELSAGKIHLVTGVLAALDGEEQMMLVGLLSDSPFALKQEDATQQNIVGSFAFTKRQATFLKERLEEFLADS